MDGTISVDGSIAVDGTTAVYGSTALDGDISVDGSIAVDGTIAVDGSTALDGTILVDGTTVVDGSRTVDGSGRFQVSIALSRWNRSRYSLDDRLRGAQSLDAVQNSKITASAGSRTTIPRSPNPSLAIAIKTTAHCLPPAYMEQLGSHWVGFDEI
jgi:hypothetical protein